MKRLLVLLLVLCGACARTGPVCNPGTCVAEFDRCHGADGEIVVSDCDIGDCHRFGDMTERDAALIDARFLCGDDDVDRQLVRIGYNMQCSDTIENLLRECLEQHRLHPHDPHTADCEKKYTRPYKHHWLTIEEYYQGVR